MRDEERREASRRATGSLSKVETAAVRHLLSGYLRYPLEQRAILDEFLMRGLDNADLRAALAPFRQAIATAHGKMNEIRAARFIAPQQADTATPTEVEAAESRVEMEDGVPGDVGEPSETRWNTSVKDV